MGSQIMSYAIILFMGVTMSLLVAGDDLNELDLGGAFDEEPPSGFLDALFGVLDSIWSIIVILIDLLTLGFLDAPIYVRAIVSLVVLGLGVGIAGLIRGSSS